MTAYLAQYRAELEGRKKTLEAELKSVKSEINSVSDMVLEDFAERGVKNVKLITGETVYMHDQPRASVLAGDWERLADEATVAFCDQAGDAASMALRELHSMFQSRINLNTLTAWVNERIAAFNEYTTGMTDEQIDAALKGPRAPLPGSLADLITLITKPTVRVRGAKAQTSDAGGGGVARINPESIANLAGQDGVIMDMGNKE